MRGTASPDFARYGSLQGSRHEDDVGCSLFVVILGLLADTVTSRLGPTQASAVHGAVLTQRSARIWSTCHSKWSIHIDPDETARSSQ